MVEPQAEEASSTERGGAPEKSQSAAAREDSPDPFPGEAGKPPEIQQWRFIPKMDSIGQTKDALTADQERVDERMKLLWSREKEFWSAVTTTLTIGGSLGKLWAEGKEYDKSDTYEKTETDAGQKSDKKAKSRRKQVSRSPTMSDLALPSGAPTSNMGRREVAQRLSKLHGPATGDDAVTSLSQLSEQLSPKNAGRPRSADIGKSFTRENVVMWDPKARNILGPKFHKFSDPGSDSLSDDQFMNLLQECRLLDTGFTADDAQQLFHFVVRRNQVMHMPKVVSPALEANRVGYADFEALMMRIAEIKGGYAPIAEGCAHDSSKDVMSNAFTRQKLLDIYNNFKGTAKTPEREGGAKFELASAETNSSSSATSDDEGEGELRLHDFINLCNSYKLFDKRWTIADIYITFADCTVCNGGKDKGLKFPQFLNALEEMAAKRGLTPEMLLYSADGLLVCLPEPIGKIAYQAHNAGDFQTENRKFSDDDNDDHKVDTTAVALPTSQSNISAAGATIGFFGRIQEDEEEEES
eukprot:gnl/MRDRNA2_/MRDRNA2_105034_c0_seq1.p1 gnl/MRDRNA2_/MRDRNA2_105034_c0~~gnl/MRDRNA2_/MRDRNA2_105034_c0_seq1.p1  ORF type:complete len:525 (-),score=127.03 gnl/MRDRNA2_/MRDRNA2_105034_c0_seq1:47-1621(-)